MFENSPVSKKIWDYFNQKYGQIIAPVGLVKACAVVSAKLDYPKLSVFVVAPTRQFKTQTTREMTRIFPKSFYIWLGSDFTIHSLYEKYKERGMDKRCLLCNDATLLFSSKEKRTKDRLISALAELISDGTYHYGERLERFQITASVSMIMNITMESYNKYESKLLGSTFLERFLTLFYKMPEAEQTDFLENRELKFSLKFGKKTPFLPKKCIKNYDFYKKLLIDYSRTYSVLSLKSYLGTYDCLVALIKAHLTLNGRDEICSDDVDLLKMLRDYLVNPFAPNESRVVEFYKQGRSLKEICLLLNRKPEDYIAYVSRVIKKAKERGLTD
jgi:hypothetical protein